MNELLNFIYFVLFTIAVSIFSFKIGKSEKLDKQDREMYNLKLLSDSLMHAERARVEEIEKSIGGINLCEYFTTKICSISPCRRGT